MYFQKYLLYSYNILKLSFKKWQQHILIIVVGFQELHWIFKKYSLYFL